MNPTDAHIARAVEQTAASTLKSAIVVIEACETPQQAVDELTKWLIEIEGGQLR